MLVPFRRICTLKPDPVALPASVRPPVHTPAERALAEDLVKDAFGWFSRANGVLLPLSL